MKKLSFIMAIIMIVMTFPMMFMTSASAEEAAILEVSGSDKLVAFDDDDAAKDQGYKFRFGDEGSNGYVQTFADAASLLGVVKYNDGEKDVVVTEVNMIADITTTSRSDINFSNSTTDFVVNGNGHTVKGTGNNCNYRVFGKVTFEDITFTTNATGNGTLQIQNDTDLVFGKDVTITNYNTAAASYWLLIMQDASKVTVDGAELVGSSKAPLVHFNGSSGNMTFIMNSGSITQTVVNGGAFAYDYEAIKTTNSGGTIIINGGVINSDGYAIRVVKPNAKLQINGGVLHGKEYCIYLEGASNCDIEINNGTLSCDKKTRGVLQVAGSNMSGNKFVVNNGTFNGGLGMVINGNAEITINGGVFTASSKTSDIGAAAVFVTNSANASNLNFILNGGTFIKKNGGCIFNLTTSTGLGMTVNGGTYIIYNFEDADIAKKDGTPSGKGMFYMSNGKYYNFNGGSYVMYTDDGSVLATKAPVIYAWGATASKTTVTGGSYTGGSAFLALLPAKSVNGTNVIDTDKAAYYGYADGKNSINIAPVVTKGASVRLDKNSGLRFTTTIDVKTVEYLSSVVAKDGNLTYGTLITRASYLKYTGGVFTKEAFEKAGKNYIDIVAKDGVSKDAAGNVIVNAALVDISADDYKKDFVAISYIKYTNANDEEVYLYATNVNLAEYSRNIEEVAIAALADVQAKAGGAYTNAVSEYYVYNVAARKYELVKGTAYSAYTADQIKALQAYIVVEG